MTDPHAAAVEALAGATMIDSSSPQAERLADAVADAIIGRMPRVPKPVDPDVLAQLRDAKPGDAP